MSNYSCWKRYHISIVSYKESHWDRAKIPTAGRVCLPLQTCLPLQGGSLALPDSSCLTPTPPPPRPKTQKEKGIQKKRKRLQEGGRGEGVSYTQTLHPKFYVTMPDTPAKGVNISFILEFKNKLTDKIQHKSSAKMPDSNKVMAKSKK